MARRKAPSSLGQELPDDAPLLAFARVIYQWGRDFLGARTITDVFVWRAPGRWKLALHGPAAALQARCGFVAGSLNNATRGLDVSLGRRLGIAVKVRHYTLHGKHHSADAEPDLFNEDGDVSPGALLTALRGAFDLAVPEGLGDDELDVCLLPQPGYPWGGAGTAYYSVRRAAWVRPDPPPWKVEVFARSAGTLDSALRPGADWCQIVARAESSPPYPAGAVLTDKGEAVMVTHAVELHGGWQWTEASQQITRCGGMLFPSLAVGPIPATNFGPGVFVADPLLALHWLKPYRRRSVGAVAPVALYATDAYTPTTSEIVGDLSARLYDELTGALDEESYLYGTPHIHATGPRMPDDEDGGPVGNHRIDTTRKMVRVLRQRFRLWKGPLDQRAFDRVCANACSGLSGLDRAAAEFAYLEGKAQGIVPMDAFVALYAPDFGVKDYEDFARGAGYAGPIHVVETTAEERRAYDRKTDSTDPATKRAKYNYAWKVAALVLRDLPTKPLLT